MAFLLLKDEFERLKKLRDEIAYFAILECTELINSRTSPFAKRIEKWTQGVAPCMTLPLHE